MDDVTDDRARRPLRPGPPADRARRRRVALVGARPVPDRGRTRRAGCCSALRRRSCCVGYAVGDLIWSPRLAADAHRRADPHAVHPRRPALGRDRATCAPTSAPGYGLRSTTLEVDAGDVLVVFSRRALGADPEAVARRSSRAMRPADGRAVRTSPVAVRTTTTSTISTSSAAEPGELQPVGQPRARRSASRRSPARHSAPVTNPPMWPSLRDAGAPRR